MTLDIWINRRPEDELADAIAAADRRKTLDELKIRHNVVIGDPAAPSVAGDCGWCATRHRLAAMSDGASRLPQFGRLVASAAGRRVVGKPCDKCVKVALGTLKRRVDAGRGKTSGGTREASTHHQSDGGAKKTSHHVDPGTTGGRTLTASAVDHAHRDCVVCQGMPAYVAPHPSWRTSIDDYRRWVASGRPPRWPA
jgi:hypothetical protein